MQRSLFFGFLLLVFLISACGNVDVSKLSDTDLERISEKAVVCNAPYIRFGTSCCLDQNNNNICDKDEGIDKGVKESATQTKTVEDTKIVPKESCVDECSTYSCEGLNRKEYVDCIKGSDGCYHKVNLGKVLGKCAIGCIDSNACGKGYVCNDDLCKQISVCGNNHCETLQGSFPTESCETCPQDCCPTQTTTQTSAGTTLPSSNLNLANYPSPFVKNGKFNAIIVVGDKATAEEVISASDISASLQFSGGPSTRIEIGAAKLASEVSDVKAQNSILIGNACTNKAISDILGNPSNCILGYTEGEGKIELFQHANGNVALMVSGYSVIDIRNAAAVLSNYRDFNLKGTRAIVRKVQNQLTVTTP